MVILEILVQRDREVAVSLVEFAGCFKLFTASL